MINKVKRGIIVSLLLMVISTIGVSFALFRKESRQETTNDITVLKCFNYTYSETSGTEINIEKGIALTNELGMQTEPFNFKLTNNCSSTNIKVKIYIEDYGTTLNINKIRASVNDENNTDDNSRMLGTTEQITTPNNKTGYLVGVFYLSGNTSKSIDVRIWIDESATFAESSGKVFDGKIYLVAEPTKNVQPSKGDLITMNVGAGLPTQYRIIKSNGTIAEVVAMSDYNIGTKYKFDADGATTTFSDGTEGQQYAGSDIDILMNETFYGKMSETAQNAIVVQNINQYIYGRTTTAPTSGTQGTDYWQSAFNFSSPSDCYIKKVGSDSVTSYVNVGNRYVYLLDIKDILDYFNNALVTKEALNTLFFNQDTSYSTNSTIGNYIIWLRSAYRGHSNYGWRVRGDNGSLNGSDYDNDNGVRPTFTIDLSKISWELNVSMPPKGEIITMDVGTGLPTEYRVLRVNGKTAEVVAMSDYNVGTIYKFDADGATTTFSDGTTGQQYAGSDIDKLMNETIYNAMNDVAKSAIVAQNINQYMYGYTTTAPTSGTQGTDYWQSAFNFSSPSNYYIKKVGSNSTTSYVNVGNRNVYLLDVKDVLDYFNDAVFTKEELNTLFFNQDTSYSTNSTMGYYHFWLRSASSSGSSSTWTASGRYGALLSNAYSNTHGARPAFTIDLTKIEWSTPLPNLEI